MTERDALRDRVEHAVGTLFEIEDEIGRGGMAVVYRARDVRLHRKVALKVLPPELAFRAEVKSRFLREAQMAAQLSHANIVPIFTVDELDGVVFFSMGLVEGETLAQRLMRDPRPPVATVRAMLREVADALAYAHARHVVHRDVKPDNILVDGATGHVMVSDFGIARAAEGESRLTVTGVAVGTPAYMSPEQAMGDREVDGRADIYALGVVGYQMLAGELPHQAANTPSMLMKHISERPRPLGEVRPDLPANLIYAIERAMAKGRDDRWPDASAFRDALAENALAPRPGLRAAAPARSAGAAEVFDPAAYGAELGLHLTGQVLGALGLHPDASSAAPSQPRAPGEQLPEYPRVPALPPGWMLDPNTREYGREALQRYKEETRRWKQRYGRNAVAGAKIVRRELKRAQRAGLFGPQTPEERIRRFQRSVIGGIGMVGFLTMINVVTSPQFPWALFPAVGITIGIFSRGSRLLIDGIPLRRLFQFQAPPQPQADNAAAAGLAWRAASAVPAMLPHAEAAALAAIPREVLDGPHGATIREAVNTKATIADVLGKLSPADRQMLPEIQPTVDSLVERVLSLAQGLHQLDADASPAAIAALDRRVAEAKAGPQDAPDLERRLQLLERQQATLKDLAARRGAVAEQLERASLVLQTMKLDLFKLRSSGLDAKLDATTGATQEARALSTDIGRVLDAANEVRKL
ncbi:MAG TPA: protein kinase [Gemmatimonadaceae bacterium]|nr:protein kinase [Gemmatimonadaceae bacterium]